MLVLGDLHLACLYSSVESASLPDTCDAESRQIHAGVNLNFLSMRTEI